MHVAHSERDKAADGSAYAPGAAVAAAMHNCVQVVEQQAEGSLILCSDLDVMPLRPLSELVRFLRPSDDLVVAEEPQPSATPDDVYNAGLMLMRASTGSRAFLRSWTEAFERALSAPRDAGGGAPLTNQPTMRHALHASGLRFRVWPADIVCARTFPWLRTWPVAWTPPFTPRFEALHTGTVAYHAIALEWDPSLARRGRGEDNKIIAMLRAAQAVRGQAVRGQAVGGQAVGGQAVLGQVVGGQAVGVGPRAPHAEARRRREGAAGRAARPSWPSTGVPMGAAPWAAEALARARDRSAELRIANSTLSAFEMIERVVAQQSSAAVRQQATQLSNEQGAAGGRGGRYWSTAHHPEQATYYARVASTPAIRTVCEVGFNAGHSTAIWLTANPRARVYSFDSGEVDYTPRCMRAMGEAFAGRVHLTKGPSERTIPIAASAILERIGNGRVCDLVHVDGDHSTVATYSDFYHLFASGLARCNETLILMDDVCDVDNCHCRQPSSRARDAGLVRYGVCDGPTHALDLMQAHGLVKVLDTYYEKHDRGWALLAPVCRGDGAEHRTVEGVEVAAPEWPSPCSRDVEWRKRFHLGPMRHSCYLPRKKRSKKR